MQTQRDPIVATTYQLGAPRIHTFCVCRSAHTCTRARTHTVAHAAHMFRSSVAWSWHVHVSHAAPTLCVAPIEMPVSHTCTGCTARGLAAQTCCSAMPSMRRATPSVCACCVCGPCMQFANGACAWCGRRRQANTGSKAAHVCGVMRLSRGAMAHRGQAPWHVLPSAMQREQPILLVRSLSASIEHLVWQARVVWSWATGPQRARLPACGVVRLSRGAMTHREQAP